MPEGWEEYQDAIESETEDQLEVKTMKNDVVLSKELVGNSLNDSVGSTGTGTSELRMRYADANVRLSTKLHRLGRMAG